MYAKHQLTGVNPLTVKYFIVKHPFFRRIKYLELICDVHNLKNLTIDEHQIIPMLGILSLFPKLPNGSIKKLSFKKIIMKEGVNSKYLIDV